MKKISLNTIVVILVGAVLFFVLGTFLSIPSGIENITITVQYGLLAFVAVVFGPAAGAISGFLGHILIDFILYKEVWISWEISSAVFAALMGISVKLVKVDENSFKRRDMVMFNLCHAVSHVLTWMLVAPVLDVLLYSTEPTTAIYQGRVIAGIDIIATIIVGNLLLYVYSKAIPPSMPDNTQRAL